MTSHRPILVGLFNPHSANPLHALAPSPRRSSGHRLHAMLAESDREVGKAYLHVFDRRNLLTVESDLGKPTRHYLQAQDMLEGFIPGSTVVLLGEDVRRAFSSVLSQPVRKLPIHPQVIDQVTWRMLPHPSGRSLAYNDLVFRRLAGMLLADLARE